MKGKKREIKRIFPSKEIDYKELKAELEKYHNSQVSLFILYTEKPWFILEDEKKTQSVYHFKEKSDSLVYTHFIGNVAEMVQEKGIVKGGSWRHKLAVSFPSKKIFVDPEKVYDWVGFRCVAEVVEIED